MKAVKYKNCGSKEDGNKNEPENIDKVITVKSSDLKVAEDSINEWEYEITESTKGRQVIQERLPGSQLVIGMGILDFGVRMAIMLSCRYLP